jgi:hypothetical protein
MRLVSFVLTAIVMLAPVPAAAQDWINYFNYEEKFSVNLPGEPTIEEVNIVSQRGDTYPQKIFRASDGNTDYVVKVINYADAVVSDVRASIQWEAWQYREAARMNGGVVTFDGYAQVDRIEGHQLQITNPDESHTYVAIHLHDRRLYVLEATVPPGLPLPMLFQVSLQILDDEGERIRYTIDADGQRVQDETETLQ